MRTARDATGGVDGQWETHHDDKGQAYYHNRSTGETSWTPPTSPLRKTRAATENQAVWEEGDDWQTHTDPKGRKYFYNPRTKQTSWTPPTTPLRKVRDLNRLRGTAAAKATGADKTAQPAGRATTPQKKAQWKHQAVSKIPFSMFHSLCLKAPFVLQQEAASRSMVVCWERPETLTRRVKVGGCELQYQVNGQGFLKDKTFRSGMQICRNAPLFVEYTVHDLPAASKITFRVRYQIVTYYRHRNLFDGTEEGDVLQRSTWDEWSPVSKPYVTQDSEPPVRCLMPVLMEKSPRSITITWPAPAAGGLLEYEIQPVSGRCRRMVFCRSSVLHCTAVARILILASSALAIS